MKFFIITGGCGFIGVNLIKSLLLQEQTTVLVIDNLTSSSLTQLAKVSPYQEIGVDELDDKDSWPRVVLLKGDIRDETLAMRACLGADAVIHLAASTGVIPSIQDPRTDCLINVIGTFNFLEAARLNGVKRFIFASSSAPLGDQFPPPIHEEMVPRPKSAYGASKLAGEGYCTAYFNSFGLETVVLRFGNVYGPNSTHKNSVVAKFIKHIFSHEPLPIYGDGKQSRDFIYVDDLVGAILLALKGEQIGGQIFQIASQQEHTVVEVARELNRLAEKHLGHKSPLVFEKERRGEVRRSFSDISKAEGVLGFVPKYDLKRGLEETFLWFLENQKEWESGSRRSQ